MLESPVTIHIPGNPTTKLRPRFSRNKGQVRTYDSQSEEANTTKWQMKARMKSVPLMEGPLAVQLVFVFAWPKSWPKKRRPLYHINKPDIDNITKFIFDCANGIVWHDDAQVSSVAAVKLYGDKGSTTMIVRYIEAVSD